MNEEIFLWLQEIDYTLWRTKAVKIKRINKFTDFGCFANVNLHLCWYDYLDFILKSVIKSAVSLMSLDISLFRKKPPKNTFVLRLIASRVKFEA